MLRFILVIILVIVLLTIGQENPMISFGILFGLALIFMFNAINSVDPAEIAYKRKMLKTQEGREKYYYSINAQ